MLFIFIRDKNNCSEDWQNYISYPYRGNNPWRPSDARWRRGFWSTLMTPSHCLLNFDQYSSMTFLWEFRMRYQIASEILFNMDGIKPLPVELVFIDKNPMTFLCRKFHKQYLSHQSYHEWWAPYIPAYSRAFLHVLRLSTDRFYLYILVLTHGRRVNHMITQNHWNNKCTVF